MRNIYYLLFLGFQALCVQGQNDQDFWRSVHYQLSVGADAETDETSPVIGIKAQWFFQNNIGLGAALNFADYGMGTQPEILQTGVEVMYKIALGGKWHAFTAFEGGYGHVFIDQVQSKKGGFYMLPKAGLIVATGRNVAININVGFMRQPWEIRIFDFFPEPTITRVVLNRYRISAGLLF